MRFPRLALLLCGVALGACADASPITGADPAREQPVPPSFNSDGIGMGSGGFMQADSIESHSVGTTSATTPQLEGSQTTLDDLRTGGRLVGVVSHVADLRQRIPAQVRVVKTMSGSRVETTAG